MRFQPTLALSASALALSLGLATPAFAQSPAPATPNNNACQAAPGTPERASCPDDEQVGDTAGSTNAEGAPTTRNAAGEQEILVTGSRIRRNQFNTADSIQLITRKEATQSGFNSTAEILQSTAVTGGTAQINDTYGGFVTNGGPGVNTISLRGLGTTRTLVLLNGRRVAPAGSRGSVGSADLNVLPNAMIDRIEVLNTGASSVYGSDAIAGVINIVTRSRINGLVAEVQHNAPQIGAGTSRRYSLTGGWTNNRLRVAGSVEYFNRDRIRTGDVSFARCPTQFYGTNGSDFGAGDFIDPRTGQPKCFPLENGGTTVNTIGTPNFNATPTSGIVLAPGVPAGYTSTCNRFRPNPLVTTGPVPGYECVGGGALSTNIRDTSSPNSLREDLISPAKILTAFGQIAYESSALGNAEFYTEVLLNRRKSEQDQQRQFTIDYPFGSPLIPVGLRYPVAFLGPQAANPLVSVGVRVFADYGIYNNRQTVDFARLNGGVRGDLPFRDWRYDFFVGKSWSDSDYTTDLILQDRLNASLDVVAGATPGTFVCRNPIGGCVAAPVLSPAVVGGQFPAAWLDYITDPVTGNTKYRETTTAFNVDGSLLKLPAGDLSVALGIEYRKASINDQPSPESVRNNLAGFTSSTPTVGKDSVIEYYGEVEIPVLRNQLIREFTINASARYTDYKSYGGQTTYKVGGLLSPTSWLSFRGSYGTSYRAPALFEQFLGATTGFLGSTGDPCDNLASVTNVLVRDRCISEGLPVGTGPGFADTFRQRSSITVVGVGGAEAGLEAETSKALTFGGVFQPNFFGPNFGDLSISLDYFRVKVENGVSQLTAANVLSQCYANPERTTCDLITRSNFAADGAGTLRVIQSYVNISDAYVSGLDFNARYAREIGPGRFRAGAAITKFNNRYNRTFPTQTPLNVIGLINNPEYTGTFDASYTVRPVFFRWSMEWIGKTDAQAYAAGFGLTPQKYFYRTPNYYLNNVATGYESDDFSITFGIRNLFNKKPPEISADYTNLLGNVPLGAGYDLRGRTFFVNFSAAIDKALGRAGF
ncbi:TonB-dependent receptor [Sphingomonas swuensis]|uniref:TonB-dependent receptor n=1 Tax=Sphingomonas swuensis TaxID=977800 RepID=A0ABP7SSG0_9SPHN